jgi:hypothetical protein
MEKLKPYAGNVIKLPTAVIPISIGCNSLRKKC